MKKVSNVIPEKSNKMYEEFISTRVLNDKDIIDFIQVNNFTKEDIYNNLEKFYQYYISKDASLDLNHKPKLSLNNGEVNITYTETEQYKQYRLASQLGNKIKTEYIANRILTYCFENLSKTKEKGLLARELIRACNDILENRSKKGAYIYGATGTGKTFLLGCVYNYLKRNGKQPAIIYYPEFIRKIKSRISNNDYTEYVDIIRTQEILLIDDIGAENTTDFIRDEILGPIINYREAEKLPTFFTSNLSYDDLLEFVSTSNNKVDYTKAVRIGDRIKSLTNPFFLDGENEREYY